MRYRLKTMTKEQCRDSGMALVLVLLLCGIFFDSRICILLAIPVLIINMTIPLIFKVFAWGGGCQ